MPYIMTLWAAMQPPYRGIMAQHGQRYAEIPFCPCVQPAPYMLQ